MATVQRITGAVAIGGRVYRAGQEGQLQRAAERAGVDLAGARYARLVEFNQTTGEADPDTLEFAEGGPGAVDVVFTPAAPKATAKKAKAAKQSAPAKKRTATRKGK